MHHAFASGPLLACCPISCVRYQMLYLTARGIGLADGTRQYLASIKQGSDSLPTGPCFLSPSRTLESLHREVRPFDSRVVDLTAPYAEEAETEGAAPPWALAQSDQLHTCILAYVHTYMSHSGRLPRPR